MSDAFVDTCMLSAPPPLVGPLLMLDLDLAFPVSACSVTDRLMITNHQIQLNRHCFLQKAAPTIYATAACASAREKD